MDGVRVVQAGLGAALSSGCLLLAACGSTSARTVSPPQGTKVITPAASATTTSGTARRARVFATHVQTERVYVPANAWKSLDPAQARRVPRRRFVRCEGQRFSRSNADQAQVEAMTVRRASFTNLMTRHSRHGWLVQLRVTLGLNEGKPTAFLEHIRIPMRVERLAGNWRWLLDSSDVHQYASGEPGCPE
jgi:hypothetical protein